MNRDGITKLIQNEPLLHAEATLKMLHPSLFEEGGGGIYFGTGLTTPKSPSIGLPFDVLMFVLVAEKLRRAFSLQKIHHHIADTHALTNTFTDPMVVKKLALEIREVMQRITRITDFPIEVHLSSEFDQMSAYIALMNQIPSDQGEYVQRELADIQWYHRTLGVRLKLGWMIQAGEAEIGFDERLYDEAFRRQCDPTMSFGYIVAGRTLDPRRQKVSPYISIREEQRILLRPDERVREKIETALPQWNGDRKLGGVFRHLNAIVRLWDRLAPVPVPQKGDPIDRVQALIQLIFS